MKSFYTASLSDEPINATAAPSPAKAVGADADSHIRTRARVAVYEAPGAAPRVEEIEAAPVTEYIEHLTTRVYELARELGGTIPYTAIREVTENFIHAHFAEPVVTILDGGLTIRFADQGPGISNKEKAVLPGFTTAHGDMKLYIRGVGSGLPIVKDYLSYSGGSLVIEDNLGSGSVVTLHARATSSQPPLYESRGGAAEWGTGRAPGRFDQPRLDDPPARQPLSTRQKQVLALVMESGSAGPSLVAKELGVGVSTAYRDLASLEEIGLIASDGGKRTLTEQGLICIDDLIAR
jgi:hypothetical protein